MADRTVRFILSGDSAGAVRAMQETALEADKTGVTIGDTIDKGTSKAGTAIGKLANIGANFGLPFVGSLDKVSAKFDETSTKGQKFGSAITEVGKIALLGGVAGVAAFGAEAFKLGVTFQDSQRQMDASIKASGESLKQWQPAIDASQQKFEALGFTNAEFDDALGRSVISTQSVSKSLDIMSVAADLARAKHIGLQAAVDSVDKALTGNIRPLMQMGISLPVVASSAQKLALANDAVQVAQAKVNAIVDAGGKGSSAYDAAVNTLKVDEAKLAEQHAASGIILDALTQRLKGQASDAAQTFAGKVNVLKAEATDLGAQIGEKLIPVVEGAVSVLVKNKGAVEAVAVAIGVVLSGAIAVFVGTKVVDFVTGIGKMITALGSVVTKVAATALSIGESDDAIIASNEAAAASFTAMLGPIAVAAAAVAGLHVLDKGGAGIGGQTISSDQSKYNQQIAGAGGNQAAIAKINATAEEFNKAASVLHKGAIVLSTGADKTVTAAANTSKSADNTTQAAGKTSNSANAALVAAQSQQAAGAAGTAAAKASSAAATKAATTQETEAKKLAAAVLAEEKKKNAILTADNKSGTAALNSQISLTTSTSLATLNTGLNATHNAALAKIEKTLDATHNKNLLSLSAQLVKVHAQALANWVAQQKAAAASGNLANAQNAAGITADQQTVSNDSANLAGLSSDALAVGQAQLAVDQQKLDQDQQDAALQAAVNAAGTATAKANAQAALDNYDAQQAANAANLAAALSAANNRATMVTNGQIPALAAGGLINKPTLAIVGEKGPEMVVPLTGVSTQQPSALPAGMGGQLGHQINVNVASNANPAQIGTEVSWALKIAS